MDRFIATAEWYTECLYMYLKSNMDRFIGVGGFWGYGSVDI